MNKFPSMIGSAKKIKFNIGFAQSLFLLLGLVAGCSLASPQSRCGASNPTMGKNDTQSAVNAITKAVSGKNLDAESIRQIQKDPEAQTAIQEVSDAVSGKNIKIKYCPVTGKRYSATLINCPEHGEILEDLKE